MDPNITILLVEDFKITRSILVNALNGIGYEKVIEAENGEVATGILKKRDDIGLVISDWNMPVMDGYSLLLWMRSREEFNNVPFIMATAQGEMIKVRKAQEAGVDGFITKPFQPEELASVISECMGEWSPVKEDIPRRDDSLRDTNGKVTINVAHIQITDHIALGVLSNLIDSGRYKPKYFELNTICMPSWNPVQSSLEKGEVDAAFVLAPIAMDIFSFGVPVKMIMLSHKNGSICVRSRSKENSQTLYEFLKGKTFYLPHTMSIHNVISDMFLREIGLTLGPVGKKGVDVFFEVVPPVRMPEFLKKNPDSCGFVVAEPFGTKAISDGISELMFFSGEFWENHPCCVVAMREDFINAHEDAVYEFTELLSKAGKYINSHPIASAEIAVEFLDPGRKIGLNPILLEEILQTKNGIRTDDLMPVYEDLDKIQRYMTSKMGMGAIIDLERFIDMRFANNACKEDFKEPKPSRIHELSTVVSKIVNRQTGGAKDEKRKAPDHSSSKVFKVTSDETSITFIISSELLLGDRVVHDSRDFLRKFGFEIFSEFKLVLRELLNNAIEHGNRKDPKKLVVCKIEHLLEEVFRISVKDQGAGFDYKSLDMSIPEDSRQIRHRGYPLIHAFCEKIEFNETGNQTTVYIRMYRETIFEIIDEKGRVTVRPNGDITAAVGDRFRSLLLKLVEDGHRSYCFDFEKVGDMDSISLSILIVLEKMLASQDRKFHLEIKNANQDLLDLFQLTHLDGTYKVHRT